MRLLIVDDEFSMREYLDVLLTREGYQVQVAGDETSARAALAKGKFDLVISDIKLGAGSGMQVLMAARAITNPPEVILITAYGTPVAAVEAMRAGAYDYICKPFDNDELKLLVQKALEKRALRNENARLRSSLAAGSARVLPGNSTAMVQLWSTVEKVAQTRTTVLITGESGTGKEILARAIHARGARSGHPFVPINCAAIAEGVLESELFGHVKGAFTGAVQDRPGILVSAGDGTVFLDEIAEISPAIQVKLLRVLQERRVKPVGSAQEVSFQARILAATNKRLEEEVKSGRFREDLLYRLNVITLELPPLRSRPEDIPQLAVFFLDRMREEQGRPDLIFAPETLRLLAEYSFPGNVRQLENLIERAATLADGNVLGPEALPPAVRGIVDAAGSTPAPAPELASGFSLERFLDDAEQQHLVVALRRAGGVKTRAAQLLGLSFRSFRYRLAKHGLGDRDEGSGAT